MNPIADMIVEIKNGFSQGKDKVIVPYSNIKAAIASIFKEKELIRDYKKRDQNLIIKLKYLKDSSPAISEIKTISQPSRRIYASHSKIPRVKSGLGFTIVSTSKGVLDDRAAKKLKVGGELICRVW